MELCLNGISYQIDDPKDLQGHFAQIQSLPFAEVWMQPAARWPAVCALINSDASCLMYLRFEADSGFSTRNPDYSGPPKAVIDYFLANGQRDEYPASWNITRNEALRALAHFFKTKEMAPWLQWHEH